MDLNATLHELPGVEIAAEVTAFMRSEHVQHLVLAAHPARGYPSGSFHVVSLP